MKSLMLPRAGWSRSSFAEASLFDPTQRKRFRNIWQTRKAVWNEIAREKNEG
jgi:hypothetical protein